MSLCWEYVQKNKYEWLKQSNKMENKWGEK